MHTSKQRELTFSRTPLLAVLDQLVNIDMAIQLPFRLLFTLHTAGKEPGLKANAARCIGFRI